MGVLEECLWTYESVQVETSMGIHTRGMVWDTLLAKWVGERKDWLHEVEKNLPGKYEMIVALFENGQTTNKKLLLRYPAKNQNSWIL